MTVRELIEQLEEMPMDYPVVVDADVVNSVELRETWYCLTEDGYSISPAVVLG